MMYVHGFASSGSSGTVMALRRHFPGWRVVAPDLPVDPFEAMDLLHATIERENPVVVVGTSMGGMYVQQLRGVRRIIVNPSFEMSRSLLFGKMGRNKYTSKRKDGATEFRIDKAVVERFKLMERGQFDGITDEDKLVGEKLAFTGAVKDDILDIELLASRLLSFLCENSYKDKVISRYNIEISDEDEGYEILEKVGRKRGMLISGGEVNTERAAITVLDEFRSGKLGKITLEEP